MRKAFTLIEILVVMGIIAVLMAILFLGFGHVSKSTHANATHATLQTLRGMLTEYETAGGTIQKLETLYDPSVPPGPSPDVAPTGAAFPGPFQIAAPTFSMAARPSAPEDPRIDKTRLVMSRLLAIPANKKVLDSLPADTVDRTGTFPILLDARHNPILYVPRRGITNVGLGKTGGATYSNPDQTINSPGAKPISKTVKEGRPFFYSAGEDANFAAGDDNLASLDQ
jgi:prepilin-type N-terminal cleavage/methylation domain-containing protein